MNRPHVARPGTVTPQMLRCGVAILVAAVVLLALAAGGARASATNGVCGTLSVPDPSGNIGTSSDPCLITSDADLDTMLSMIDADTGHNGASTLDYKLTANLDYSKDSSNTTGAATANWSGVNWFSGTFNGDGHTISNLNYTSDSFSTPLPGGDVAAGSNLGFFRVLNGATVENLTLQNVHASNTATSNLSVGGVSVWSFGSTVTGVALADPTIFDGPGGGNNYVGGLVALAYANSYADDGSSVSDGGTTNFTNNSVSGGSIADYNRTGGIVGMATGPTTVADNDVNSTLSNPGHPVAGAGGQANTFFYVIGGLVGEVGATYTTAGGAQAAGVSMADNVIGGTIMGLSTDHRSLGGQNFASATVGYATTATFAGSGSSPTASNWSTSNNLVSSSISYTNETGSGIAGADGSSVSPQTLATESTYNGTATGVTDSTTGSTFDDLGWNFGAANPSGWAWTGSSTSGAPAVQVNAGLTVQTTTIPVVVNTAPSDATLLSDAGATAANGTPTIDTSNVNFTTDGSYPATISATGALADPVAVTIVVYTAGTVIVGNSTITLGVSATAPSDATVLNDLGAMLPPGATGPLAVDLTGAIAGDQAVQWDQPGSYAVTVSDTNAGDALTATTATINIIALPVVTVANQTVYFNIANPPTASSVITAAGAALTDANGNPASGTLSATLSTSPITAPGTYTATIVGTDSHGVMSDPVTVSVVVTDAAITLANSTVTFQETGTAPSVSAVVSKLGAAVTNGSGNPTVDLSSVNFAKAGSYQVTVTDDDAHDVATPVKATIDVVPVSVVTVPNPTVFFNASNPPTAASILSASGAEITDGNGNAVSGILSASVPQGCGASAGTCTATITGTDMYGFATAPVTVAVDVSAAAVAVANATATFTDTGSAPSQAALVSALGATVTGSTTGGTPVVNTSGVDWSVPATYGVTVSDSTANDRAPTVSASIQVVPVPVVTLPTTNIYLPVSATDPLPAATLLASANPALTDGQGNNVAGTLSADTSGVNGSVAGTYTATITGTDQYGFQSAPVTVNVVIYLSTTISGTVTISGKAAVGATLTANPEGWPDLAPLQYQWLDDGQAIPGASSATYVVRGVDAGQSVSVTVTEAPAYYHPASATSAPVTIGNLGANKTSAGPSGPAVRRALTSAVDALASSSSSMPAIYRAKAVRFTFSAPSAGQLEIGWYMEVRTRVQFSRRAKTRTEAKVEKVLIASNITSFRKARKETVAVRLNPQGRKLLEGTRTVKIIQQDTFIPTGGSAMTVTKTVTLKTAR